MALEFQRPPDWLAESYVNPRNQNPVNDLLNIGSSISGAYMAQKQQKARQQQAALKQYIDAFGAGGPTLANQIAQRTGLQNPPSLPGTTSAQVPSGGTAGVSYSPSTMPPAGPAANPMGTPAEQDAQQSLPDEHTNDIPGVPTMATSPIVQASLAAGHPNHAGLTLPTPEDPTQYLNMGSYGDNKLKAMESLQKLTDSQRTTADKNEENGPVPFDYGRGFAQNAGQPNAAEPFITNAQAQGRNTLTKREMSDMKDSINARSQANRGDAYSGGLNIKQDQLRQSLNKDARDVLNPYFASGTGKDQVSRLQSIGRTEPIIQQMLAQKNGGTPQQMRELATSFNRVLTGSGLGAEGQIDALVPDTGRGRLANLQQYLSNEPQGTKQQAVIQQMADSLAREKAAVTGQIKSQAESTAPTLRLLKQHYPEDYQAQLDSVLKNPTLTGSPQIGTTGIQLPTAGAAGPHGASVTQNGHTFYWNGTTYE